MMPISEFYVNNANCEYYIRMCVFA